MAVAARPAVGAPLDRVEGAEKVTGEAHYAFERLPDGVAYAFAIQAPIAKRNRARRRQRRRAGDSRRPDRHQPRGRAASSSLFPTPSCSCCSRPRSPTAARSSRSSWPRRWRLRARRPSARGSGSTLLPHDVVLRADHPELYAPETVNAGFPTDAEAGDLDAGLARGRGHRRRHVRRRRRFTTTRWSRTRPSRRGRAATSSSTTPRRAPRTPAARSRRSSAWRPRACASSPTTSAAASAPRARRGRRPCSPRWPPRSSGGRSSSPSPASRCSPSRATGRRRSSACDWARRRTAR